MLPRRRSACDGSWKNALFFSRAYFTAFFALSTTRSTLFLILPVVWSSFPSLFRRRLSVNAPTASFTRPLILSLVPLITLYSSWSRPLLGQRDGLPNTSAPLQLLLI